MLDSASEMKILQYVTELWAMTLTAKIVKQFSVMTGPPRYARGEDACACVGQTVECKRPKIDFTRYFIHVWIGAPLAHLGIVLSLFCQLDLRFSPPP